MSTPTQLIPTPEVPPPSRPRANRRLRRAVGVLAIVVLVLLLAVAGTSDGSDTESAAGETAAGGPGASPVEVNGPDPTDPIDPSQEGDATEEALDASDDSTGFADGGANVEEDPVEAGDGDGPVELDPVGDVDELCAQVLATGASLLVTPDPAHLEPGDMSDALTIRNCGDADIDWTAHTIPDVALDTVASTLAAGQTTQLGFTIDSDAFEPGAIDFKIKVSEPGHNEYVDVHAFRKTFGKDVAAGNGFTAGQGCSVSCITKAILTPNATSPNVSFEVKTNTPAQIEVWVDTSDPDVDGPPMDSSPANATQWNTLLAPLAADTTYHLVLRATDEHGTDERSTTFKTTSPVDVADGFAAKDPKCHAQCITKAILTPGDDFSVQHLDVVSKTRARFQVWVSEQAPTYVQGVPTVADPVVFEASGLTYQKTWKVDLEPLDGSTTYHIVVRAEDDGEGFEHPGVAHRVGTFTSAPEPTYDVLVTFHELTVTHDGDSSWKNRGELSFAWAVGDEFVGSRAEEKMSDGDGFSFNRGRSSYLATGLRADEFLPSIRVSGSERDPDGIVEFCVMGQLAAHEHGSLPDCDAKWNVAKSGLVKVAAIDSLTRCAQYGIAEPTGSEGCLLLETVDVGDDYARFQVVVSLHVAASR